MSYIDDFVILVHTQLDWRIGMASFFSLGFHDEGGSRMIIIINFTAFGDAVPQKKSFHRLYEEAKTTTLIWTMLSLFIIHSCVSAVYMVSRALYSMDRQRTHWKMNTTSQ